MAHTEPRKEPQGSGRDKGGVRGKTGGTVEKEPQKKEGGHDAFDNPRRDNETSSDFQGGRISPEQLADNAAAQAGSAAQSPASAGTAVRQSR